MRSGVVMASLAAIACACAPMGRAKSRLLSPAEVQPASRQALDRLSFAQDRMAVVLSLWFEQPTRQCAVGVRYHDATEELDRVLATTPAGESGARALQARLKSAGFQFGAAASGHLAPQKIRRAA